MSIVPRVYDGNIVQCSMRCRVRHWIPIGSPPRHQVETVCATQRDDREVLGYEEKYAYGKHRLYKLAYKPAKEEADDTCKYKGSHAPEPYASRIPFICKSMNILR